jgi:hypothetical protein
MILLEDTLGNVGPEIKGIEEAKRMVEGAKQTVK